VPIFQNDEQGYQDWFEANPESRIVNTPPSGKAGQIMLHHNTPTRSCSHITPPWPGHFYTRDKIKHCFATRAELIAWYRRERPALTYCRSCAPEPV
jgi:hypothetical protein